MIRTRNRRSWRTTAINARTFSRCNPSKKGTLASRKRKNRQRIISRNHQLTSRYSSSAHLTCATCSESVVSEKVQDSRRSNLPTRGKSRRLDATRWNVVFLRENRETFHAREISFSVDSRRPFQLASPREKPMRRRWYPFRNDRFHWRYMTYGKFSQGVPGVGRQNDSATRSFSLLIVADAFPRLRDSHDQHIISL